jgi:trans-2,3-dihydro-3-hydroxyanthranilate isomerase
MLPGQARGAPDGDEQPDDEQEPRPPGAELPFRALGTLAAPCGDEGEPVAEDERRPQSEDHLGQQAVEVEDVGHGPSVAARIADRKPPVRSLSMRMAAVVRVFTRGAEGGNHLGVVSDASDLDAGRMQAIAAHLGYSETIFLDRRADETAVRIFTPSSELPFAGHPLVGAAWSLGDEGVMVCGIGRVRYEADGGGARVRVPMTRDVRRADASGIAAEARLPDPVRSWWADMPIPYLVVEAESAGAVAEASPDIRVLETTEAAEATMLFARDGGAVRARFFAPGLGVDEDPATGSAAVALAAVLFAEGEESGALVITQGVEIGHPSEIRVSWDGPAATLGGSVRPEDPRRLP